MKPKIGSVMKEDHRYRRDFRINGKFQLSTARDEKQSQTRLDSDDREISNVLVSDQFSSQSFVTGSPSIVEAGERFFLYYTFHRSTLLANYCEIEILIALQQNGGLYTF